MTVAFKNSIVMRFRLSVFLVILLASAAPQARAQALRIVDTRFYCNGITRMFNRFHTVIQTRDNGFFFTAVATKPGGGLIPPCPGTGVNPCMGKLDSLGNVEWVKNFCDTPISASSVCQTPDGGYAINGGSYYWNSMSIFRYDAQGNYLWRRDYGKGANCGTSQIVPTPDKSFLLLGFAKGIDSDITTNYSWPPVTFQPYDWVLIKLDSLGNKQWVRTLGTSGDEYSAQALVCDGKSYYLIGSTDSKDHDCADVANHPGFAIYTIKLDNAGNVLWSKAHGAGFVNDVLYDERDNSIVVVGRAPGGGGEFPPGHGYDDIFLMKLDTAGNYKWGNLFGTNKVEPDGATCCKAPNGGYFLAGSNYDNTPAYAGLLVSVDSNGNMLDQHEVTAPLGGVIFNYVFPFKNTYCVFGQTAALSLPEGTGSNCITINPKGVYALTLSTLKMLPLSVADAATSLPNFMLVPNPAQSSVELRFGSNHTGGSLTVTGAGGSVLLRRHIAAAKASVALSTASWLTGVYLVCWQPQGASPYCATLLVQPS